MSRTGKRPIILPEKVKAHVTDGQLFVEGPLGKHSMPIHPFAKMAVEGQKIVVTRIDDTPDSRRIHGLMQALAKNIVDGLTKGFSKSLLIEGVGYRAEVKGKVLNMTLGFSHPIDFAIPEGIKVAVDKQTKITVSGNNRALLGETVAKIRSFRPPEPYKGKGIRYENEVIQRKVGKAAATSSGGGAK